MDFRAYEARYQRATRKAGEALSSAQLLAAVRHADVVFVGDYHTLRMAQDGYLALVTDAMERGRAVQLALGDLPVRAQAQVDSFLAGRSSRASLWRVLDLEDEDPFGPRTRMERLLNFARARGCPVIALETEPRGRVTLARRDARSGRVLAGGLRFRPDHQTFVLSGQYHVTPAHLPRAMQAHASTAVRSLVVYQNCEQLYFQLRDALPHAVRLGANEICWMTASPLACQQSFLDCLDAEDGDCPLQTPAPQAFSEMARQVGKVTGVKVETGLRDVRVRTSVDGTVLDEVRRARHLNLREQGQVRRHVLALQSGYFPRAQLAFLARGSVNHAAEEASHFVRHCAIGDAIDAARPVREAFYARCLEEALGFFGSRLINPRRQCRSAAAWSEARGSDSAPERRAAGFWLAHRTAEVRGSADWDALVPDARSTTFHDVSHGLGYALGAALHMAFVAKRVSRAEVRALFADPLEHPRALYFAWAKRLRR